MEKKSDHLNVAAAVAGIIGTLVAVLGFFGITYASLSHKHPNASVSEKLSATTLSLLGQPEKAIATLNPIPAAVGPVVPPVQPAVQPRAQAPVAIQSASSNGVTVSVTGLAISGERLYANLQIVNNTTSRFYFLDAAGDAGQHFAIASGGDLGSISAANMPSCTSDANSCLNQYAAMAPSQFTYLEPKSSMTASLGWYLSGDSKQTAKAGSFGVTLIGHLLAPGATLTDTDKAQVFRFNFTGIPVAR